MRENIGLAFQGIWLAGRNLYHIVLKAQPFLQRNIDSGVSPKTKVHGFFVFIFHGNLHMQRGIFQTVTDGIAEQERILLIERRAAFQHEGYGNIRLLCNGELRRRCKAMNGHMVQLPPIPVTAIGQPCHIGENGQ